MASCGVTSINGDTGVVTLGWADIPKTGSLISDIANVDDSAKSVGDILEWDGTNWIAAPPASFTDTNASTLCGAGQVLLGDGSCADFNFTDTSAATLCAANQYLDGDGTCKAVPVDTNTNAATLCTANQYLDGDGTSKAVPTPTTSLSVANITNATGDYFTYQPDDTPCADGGVLKWSTANTR